MQNALVLKAPSKARGAGVTATQKVVLRAPDRQSGSCVLVGVRQGLARSPVEDRRRDAPSLVTLESVLLGTKPVRAASGGAR